MPTAMIFGRVRATLPADACDFREAAVAGALEALIGPTMAEPGVKLFLPYRSPTDPRSFFIFQLYRNEAGWVEHQRTGRSD